MATLRFLLALCLLGSASAADLDFELKNATPLSFEAVYLSASTDKDWDGNLLLHGKSLEAGRSLHLRFDPSEKSGSWDLRVVDSEGLAVTFKNLKLTGAESVTLKEENGKVSAEVE
jgi:hypothetical protein